MAWPKDPRPAKSLLKLLNQANALAPDRDKSNDGLLGDQAHASRASDHNPLKGVVRAVDITHDPAGGLDSYKLAETLRQNRDPRIKYVISAGKIFSPTQQKWQWRKYVGKNAHRQHVHVSVLNDPDIYDNMKEWNLHVGPIVSAPAESTPPTLWRGAKGEHVKELQKLLKIKVDGDFGRVTEAAVKAFQKANKLTVDGVAGQYTWLALLS